MDLRLTKQCPKCVHYIDNIEDEKIFEELDEQQEKCFLGNFVLTEEKCLDFKLDF